MVDLTTRIGSVVLPNPVMPASGTAGHGTELGAYVDLAELGAVVVKSLAHFAHDGNNPLRTHATAAGMLNSVGLQGPGVAAWMRDSLPKLIDAGARIVVSIWGRSVDDYRRAADLLADCPAEVVAVEVNLSCPNTEAGGSLLAHDPDAAAATIAATEGCGRPRWAKLSPNTDRNLAVAAAVHDAGAEAIILTNTLLGMAIDPVSGRYALGAGANGGGYSGTALHPVAVRQVHDVHRSSPTLPIVGVGGISNGDEALEFLRAGAVAVQVGTANFADPRATQTVLAGLAKRLDGLGVARLADVVGTASAV